MDLNYGNFCYGDGNNSSMVIPVTEMAMDLNHGYFCYGNRWEVRSHAQAIMGPPAKRHFMLFFAVLLAGR